MELSAEVGGDIALYDLDAITLARLRKLLSYPNPAFVRAQRFNEETGDLDERLSAVDEHPDHVRVPRGAIYTMRSLFEPMHIRVHYRDRRSWGEPLDVSVRPDCGLQERDYQDEGASLIKRLLQGLAIIPPGGGKTILGALTIARVRRSTIVLVPTRDLLAQWIEVAAGVLGIDAAQYGDGKHQLGPLTIATKDAIAAHPELDLSSFGLCIYDECHRSATVSSQRLMSRIPARYRLGLTATEKREDGTTPLVFWTFGEELVRRSVKQLVDAGYLVLPRAEAIYTDFSYDIGDEPTMKDYTKLTDALCGSTRRAQRIVKLVCERRDLNTLVLANRKAYCERLRRMLEKRGYPAVVITSETKPRSLRKKLMADFRAGLLPCVIATSLADEGLNVPSLRRLVLALPERAQGKTIQRIGRLMRPSDPPIVYDIVDHLVPNLLNRWLSRRSVYRHLGMEIQECPTLSLFATTSP